MKPLVVAPSRQDDHTPLSQLTPIDLLEVCGSAWSEMSDQERVAYGVCGHEIDDEYREARAA